jgi:hypothetical protein
MGRAAVEKDSQSWIDTLRKGVFGLARPVHKRLRQEKLDLSFSLAASVATNNLPALRPLAEAEESEVR